MGRNLLACVPRKVDVHIYLVVQWGFLLSKKHGAISKSLPSCCCCSATKSLLIRLFLTPWTAAHQASLSLTISLSLPKFKSIEPVMPSNHLILCHPLLLLPSVFPSIWVFSNESTLPIRWPKYWSFSFNISPSNEHIGLISFQMDWLDLLAAQGTLKSLLQHQRQQQTRRQRASPTGLRRKQ